MPAPARADVQKHMPALDGLRAIAILWVVLHNTDLLDLSGGWARAPVALLHDGWAGVTLFFVLSGFLITGNLLDTRGGQNFFSSFYARRSLRILPLYYGTLVLFFAILPQLGAAPDSLSSTAHRQWSLWLFVSNWTEPLDGGVTGFVHFWSLAIEEQFYLVWPLVVLFLDASGVLIASLLLVVGALVVRTVLAMHGASHDVLYMNTFCRMDALAAGAAAAALPRLAGSAARLTRLLPWAMVAVTIVLAAVLRPTHFLSIFDVDTQTFGYTALTLFFAVIVLAAAQRRGLPGPVLFCLDLPPLRRVARYSYGMYVFHLPLHVFVMLPLLHRLVPLPSGPARVLYMACALVLTFLLAGVSYELFERPILGLRRRFRPIPAH